MLDMLTAAAIGMCLMAGFPADLARRYGISRTPVTRVMNLLRLSERVREYLTGLPEESQRLYSERRLRRVAGLATEKAQVEAFRELRETLGTPMGCQRVPGILIKS